MRRNQQDAATRPLAYRAVFRKKNGEIYHIAIEDDGALTILRDLMRYSARRHQAFPYQFEKTGFLSYDVWMVILSFALGVDGNEKLELLGNFALYESVTPIKKFSLFSIKACDVSWDVLTPLVLGDVERTKRMIDVNPRYLLSNGSATGFCGKKIECVTPLQMAVAVDDADLLSDIEASFSRFPEGGEKINNQLKEILKRSLRGYLEKLEKQSSGRNEILQALESNDLLFIFEMHRQAQINSAAVFNNITLNLIKDAINSASEADIDAMLAIENNHSVLSDVDFPLFRHSCTQFFYAELIFNPFVLFNAFKINNTMRNAVSSSVLVTEKRYCLFSHRVLGYLQRFVPANYAQAFAQGLDQIVQYKKPLLRSLCFQWDLTRSFYPVFNSPSGLGFTFSVTRGVYSYIVDPNASARTGPREFFSKFIADKENQLRELCKRAIGNDQEAVLRII